VAIARALVNDPSIILADEPTGNLDTRSSEDIMDVLHQLHDQGATIVMVTHDSDIAQHAGRVTYLLDGQVVSDNLHAGSLTLNKGRSFLTTLGVIIGVGAVIVMMAVSAGAEAEIADQINALGANLIMVMPAFSRGGFGPGQGRPPALSYDDVEAIAQSVTGINGVSAEQATTQDISGGGTTLESIEVVGTTAGFPNVREYRVAEGRFLTDEDNGRAYKVAVLGYDIAQELFGEQSAIGQSVKIGSARFTVVGVMAEKGVVGTTDYDGRVYIPITVVFKKFTSARFGGDSVRLIYVSAESKEMMGDVMSHSSTSPPRARR